MDPHPSRLAGVAYALATLGLIVIVVVGVALVALPFLAGDGDNPRYLVVPAEIHPDQLDSLPSDVELQQRVEANIRIPDPTPAQHVTVISAAMLWAIVSGLILYLLRAVIGSVRTGDPFTSANTRRLRMIGLIVLIGGPLGDLITPLITQMVLDPTGIDTPFQLSFSPTLPLVGLGVLVLAEVFRHGVRLREDVEATI